MSAGRFLLLCCCVWTGPIPVCDSHNLLGPLAIHEVICDSELDQVDGLFWHWILRSNGDFDGEEHDSEPIDLADGPFQSEGGRTDDGLDASDSSSLTIGVDAWSPRFLRTMVRDLDSTPVNTVGSSTTVMRC